MKLIDIIAATVSLFATVTAARQCPLESDCIERLCTDFRYSNGGEDRLGNPRTIILVARCKDDAGKEFDTSLDLKRCLANFDGMLTWSEVGNHNCEDCAIIHESEHNPVLLKCNYCPRKDELLRGSMWSWIDLSYGIWVRNGAIGCFSQEGAKTEV